MSSILSDRAEDDTMRRGKKIHAAALVMLCLATLTTGACVTQSTYDTAAADLEGGEGRTPQRQHSNAGAHPTSQRPPTTPDRPRKTNGGRLVDTQASRGRR